LPAAIRAGAADPPPLDCRQTSSGRRRAPSVTPEQRVWFWKGYRLGRMYTGKLVRRLARNFEDEFATTEVDAVAIESEDAQAEAEAAPAGVPLGAPASRYH
jgi:hypothetical protein